MTLKHCIRLMLNTFVVIILVGFSFISANETDFTTIPLGDSTFTSLFTDDAKSGWEFSPNIIDYNIDDWSAKLRAGDEVRSNISASESGNGVLVSIDEPHARGDIVLQQLQLKPFTWYKIILDMNILSGSPQPTAGLSPVGSIRRLDIDHLKFDSLSGHHSALIHTGKDLGPYDLKISLIGYGVAKFEKVSIQEGPEYIKPGGTVLVLDLLSLERSDQNLNLWENIKNLVYVFGFDTIQIIHPLDASKKKIDKINPDLMILSPTAIAVGQKPPGFIWKKRFNKGVKNFIDHGKLNEIPLFGICAGHQELARSNGAFLAKIKDDTTGNYIYEIGPTELHSLKEDIIFKDLPNYPKFTIMQAHTMVVHSEFQGAEILAYSEFCPTQIYKYSLRKKDGTDLYWYSFQGHIEKDWYRSTPDGARIFKNMLEQWNFIKIPSIYD